MVNRDSVRLVQLESFYQEFKKRVQKGVADDTLMRMLTEESQRWVVAMEEAAQYESASQVESRPFHEQLTILTYRLFERDDRLRGVIRYPMLHLAVSHKGSLKTVFHLKLGPLAVKFDRGTQGLAQSPKVPLLFFLYEDGRWKMDLIETLPKITRGLESISLKKDWSASKTILYLLEKSYRNEVDFDIDQSLLEPR